MSQEETITKQLGNDITKLHHAYVVEGKHEELFPYFRTFIEETLGVVREGNPDFIERTYELFSIDEVRRLRDIHQKKSFSDIRIFLISTKKIPREAQNALLKILEEPALSSHFFIIIPALHTLLPTLRSRVMTLSYKKEDEKHKEAEQFLLSKYKDRLSIVEVLLKEEEVTHKSISFLNALEKTLYKREKSLSQNKPLQEALHEIQKGRDYLHLQGASVKGVLEYLSLIIPVSGESAH